MRRTYMLVGASCRGLYMFARQMVKDFADLTRVVAVFDPNPLRAEVVRREAGLDCPIYTDFDKMAAEVKADRTIVTTVDSAHHKYVVKSLEAGMDAIVEKPMTIDAEKCQAILEAEKRTGRKVMVTFNMRYMPYITAIKQIIKDGHVGKVLNVDLEYMLDTVHGANYFRRWHRRKENSGGLLVHKSTHHFDAINWWIEEEPVEVTAFGSRRFYGPTRLQRGERCLTCVYSKSCEYYLDINADPILKTLYADCESADGYQRDGCVFSDDIDIEDTMSVNIRYSEGAMVSYSLIAHSPYEGWKVAINGTEGRIEAGEFYTGLKADEPLEYVNIYNRNGGRTTHAIPKILEVHGGGDSGLLEMLFRDGVTDPLGHQAGSYAGAISVLIGIAANKSISEGRNVRLDDLVPLHHYRNCHQSECS